MDDRSAETRARIVAQAEAYFRQFGYQKTTVADIAKALKMSPANVYRFFDSKKAINEAVAQQLMGEVEAELAAIVDAPGPAIERLRTFLATMHECSTTRYVGDRMMHEMVAVALDESWDVVQAHIVVVRGLIVTLIAQGVAEGSFAPVDPGMAAACVHAATVKYCHPMIIAQCAMGDPGPDLQTMTEFLIAALRAGCGAPRS